MMPGDPLLTWTCHVCLDTREDRAISVLSLPFDDIPGATQNVRYCNDRSECRRLAHLGIEGNAHRRAVDAMLAPRPVTERPGISPGLRRALTWAIVIELTILLGLWVLWIGVPR